MKRIWLALGWFFFIFLPFFPIIVLSYPLLVFFAWIVTLAISLLFVNVYIRLFTVLVLFCLRMSLFDWPPQELTWYIQGYSFMSLAVGVILVQKEKKEKQERTDFYTRSQDRKGVSRSDIIKIFTCSFLLFAFPLTLLSEFHSSYDFQVVGSILRCVFLLFLFIPCLTIPYGLSRLSRHSLLLFCWIPLVCWYVELSMLSYILFESPLSVGPCFFIESTVFVFLSTGIYMMEDIKYFLGRKERRKREY